MYKRERAAQEEVKRENRRRSYPSEHTTVMNGDSASFSRIVACMYSYRNAASGLW